MTSDAREAHPLSVQKQVTITNFNGTNAKRVRVLIQNMALRIDELDLHLIQVRVINSPQFGLAKACRDCYGPDPRVDHDSARLMRGSFVFRTQNPHRNRDLSLL